MKLKEQHPIIVTLGSGLLGYVAGMMVSDVALKARAHDAIPGVSYLAGVLGAALVMVVGTWLAKRRRPTDYSVT